MRLAVDDDRDRLIDRLVDGALAEPDRQALLARLDAEPGGDGWRHCALAFLEAQAWREALGPVARSALPVEVVSGGARRGFRRVARLAVAAGVLGAFALGWLARGGAGGAPAPVVAPFAVKPPDAVPTPVVDVPQPDPTPAPAAESLADSRPSSSPSPFSDAVLDDWASRGYQVERRQRVISLGFDDGRSVPVPVSEVRLRYVGDRTY